MAINSTMGLKKIWSTPSTGSTMPANGSAWKDFGDVYKDTCTLKDGDATETVHESETSSKKITQVEPGETTAELSLMDPDLAWLAEYFGGEITGATGAKKWIRPRKLPYKEHAVWLQPEEGLLIGCPNVRIIPKFEITYSSKGICLVPIVIKFQADLHAQENEGNLDPSAEG